MSKQLVTGAARFIGSNFVHYWTQNYPDHTVVALDALTYAGNLASVEGLQKNGNFELIIGNILD